MNLRLGATLFISGTTIGAGMLALPISSSLIGFIPTVILLCAIWGLMYYASLITLELNLLYPQSKSLSAIAEKVYGKIGKNIVSFLLLFLFYALISAYIVGGASILKQIPILKNISIKFIILGFTFILGFIVSSKMTWIDYTNRFMFLVKVGCFLILCYFLIYKVNYTFLINENTFQNSITSKYLTVIPILFTSFGFHGSIPSIVNYLNANPLIIKPSLLWGSCVPLIVYIVWIGISLGIIPQNGPLSFDTIIKNNNDLGIFLEMLSSNANLTFLNIFTTLFSFLAITTSFLGVSKGVLDFFNEKQNLMIHYQKIQNAVLTFGIPLCFALFYPQGFIMALGYAAIALSFLAIIVPSILSIKLRKIGRLNSSNTYIHLIGLYFCLISALCIVCIECFI